MSENWFAYVGMMSAEARGEIRRFRYRGNGALEPAGTTPAFESPSYFASHGKTLYVASDSSAGAIAAFVVGESGGLSWKNALPSEGSSTCHLVLDASGEHAYAANYGSGSLSGFAIGEDGTLLQRLFTLPHEGHSVVASRQASPHVHCLAFTPDRKWLCAVDLGTDRIEQYRYDGKSGLLERDASRAVILPAGLGPRHLAFHPRGSYAYVVCELGNAVVSMRYDADQSRLEPFQQVSTLPNGWRGESAAAAIRVSADGRFVYASNRGHDSIAWYAVFPRDGSLELRSIVPSGGHWTRDIALDPTGRHLFAANQESGLVVGFDIDGETGGLSRSAGHEVEVPHCSCIHFMRV